MLFADQKRLHISYMQLCQVFPKGQCWVPCYS